MTARTLLGTLVLLLAASPGRAQDRKFTIDFGAGGTIPLAAASDVFASGVHLEIGSSVKLLEAVELRPEYLYSAHGGSGDLPASFPDQAAPAALTVNHRLHYLGVGAAFYPRMAARLRVYGIGGVGIYHRSVELTSAGSGELSLCHPNLYVCTSGFVPVADVLQTASSTGAGVNFGAGFTLRVNGGLQLFVEARWHTVASPNGRYLPITVGVRF